MNKYTKELEEARHRASASYLASDSDSASYSAWVSYLASAWSSASSSASYWAAASYSEKELEFQIDKVLELLDE